MLMRDMLTVALLIKFAINKKEEKDITIPKYLPQIFVINLLELKEISGYH